MRAWIPWMAWPLERFAVLTAASGAMPAEPKAARPLTPLFARSLNKHVSPRESGHLGPACREPVGGDTRVTITGQSAGATGPSPPWVWRPRSARTPGPLNCLSPRFLPRQVLGNRGMPVDDDQYAPLTAEVGHEKGGTSYLDLAAGPGGS